MAKPAARRSSWPRGSRRKWKASYEVGPLFQDGLTAFNHDDATTRRRDAIMML
jgi:hypothetical protein